MSISWKHYAQMKLYMPSSVLSDMKDNWASKLNTITAILADLLTMPSLKT